MVLYSGLFPGRFSGFTEFSLVFVHLKSKRCLPAFLSIAARCSHYFQIYDSLRLSIPSNFYLNLHSCDCDIMVIVMWIVGSYLKNMTAIWKTWPTRWDGLVFSLLTFPWTCGPNDTFWGPWAGLSDDVIDHLTSITHSNSVFDYPAVPLVYDVTKFLEPLFFSSRHWG